MYHNNNSDHILKSVVERCISRNKLLRYSNCSEIIHDIREILLKQIDNENHENTISKIANKQFDNSVYEYVLKLVNNEQLARFIVKMNLYHFHEIIIKFETPYQVRILQSIHYNFKEATGYRGWENYDIFANIAYNLNILSSDNTIKSLSMSILEDCANIRYQAKDLLDSLIRDELA